MEIAIDAKARRLLERRRPGQAVLVTLLCTYALPSATLVAEWCPMERAARDPDLIAVGASYSAPVYAHRRLAAYARWQPLVVTACGPGWWSSLAVERAGEVLRDLVRWEGTHPGLREDGWRHSPAA